MSVDGTSYVTRSRLISDLSQLDVRLGDMLIVHCSMKAVGWVRGGPEQLVASLLEVVGPSGTILMPAFTKPPDEKDVIDLSTAPARTGLLGETFRKTPGVVRSAHPTHSITIWGRRADELALGHELTSGLGLASPLHKAAMAGAEVLMIGCDLTSCSLIHVAEALVRPAYLGRVTYPSYDRPLAMIDTAGRRSLVQPCDVPGDSQGFGIVHERMEAKQLIQNGMVGQAPTLKFNGQDCMDTAVELLEADPAALLCNDPACAVCPTSRELLFKPTG